MNRTRQYILTAALVATVGAGASMPAEAGLVRRAGATIAQDSFNDSVWLMNGTDFFDTCCFVGGEIISGFSRNSLHPPTHATPIGECWDNLQFVEVSPGSDTYEQRRTDCDYEFEQGEMLELIGDVTVFLPGALYELLWTISGEGKSWEFEGTFGDAGAPTGKDGSVFLNTLMPDDMGPGDYLVSLVITMFAPDGTAFFEFSDITDEEICIDVEDPDPRQICGQTGTVRDEVSRNGEYADLRVYARVPEPGTLSLLLLGALGLLATRRRQL